METTHCTVIASFCSPDERSRFIVHQFVDAVDEGALAGVF